MATNFNIALMSLLLLLASNANAQSGDFDVTKYGAKPNADITEALTSAWKEACAAAGSSKVVVPKSTYKLGPVSLLGPCKGTIEFQVDGTLQASADPKQYKDSWVTIETVDQFTLSGSGTFDGQGQTAWKQNNCGKDSNCGSSVAVNLRFNFLTSSVIRDITSLNSKNFHLFLFGCKDVQIQHLTITAPGDSPNTDGIHIGRSSLIGITDTNIGTGDDCISLGDGSQDITITKVKCGPGHGISIGSLGKYKNEEPVSGIKVTGCTISNTMNGIRIKTWPGSPSAGVATGLHFEDITMNDVENPILIDQEYCPSGHCKSQNIPSTIKISDVSFINIRGTSSTLETVKLACSKSVPCEKVTLQDIDLKYTGSDGEAKSICNNVKPTLSGTQNPPACTGSVSA